MSEKFTVADRLAEDSLIAVDSYRNQSALYKPVVVGGIATQLYIHPNSPHLVRPTHDLDVLVTPRLSADEFRQKIGRNLSGSLVQYDPKVNVARHVYEILVKDENGSPFFVHSYKWTEKGWERNKRKIERMASNASRLPIPNSDKTVHVVRPEDIIAEKLERLRKIGVEGNIPREQIINFQYVKDRDWSSLGQQEFNEWLSSLISQKNNLPAFYDRGAEEFKKSQEEYVSSKDLFDISIIARLASEKKIDFDESYYDKILQGTE